MKIHGYCTECHRIARVDVSRSQAGSIQSGVCDNCRELQAFRVRLRKVFARLERCIPDPVWEQPARAQYLSGRSRLLRYCRGARDQRDLERSFAVWESRERASVEARGSTNQPQDPDPVDDPDLRLDVATDPTSIEVLSRLADDARTALKIVARNRRIQ